MSQGKKIAKNTMYLYIRMFLVMIVSLYTVRVVIKTLGVVDYRIFNAVGGIILMMSFLSQTITFAAQRYFSFELGRNNLQRLRVIFCTVLIIYVIVAVVIALIAEIVGVWFLENKMIIPNERMVAAHWVLHFSLLSFITHILYTPYNAMIIAHENMKVYAYVSIIEVFLKLGIVYLLVLSSIDKLTFYSFLLFCAAIIIASIYILYCYYHYKETHLIFKPDKSMFSELMKYSSWTMFGALASVANQQGSSILLNVFWGPVANASQSVANQVSHALQLFGSNIFAAIRPPMTKMYAQGKFDEVIDLFFKSSKYTLLLLYLIMLPLFMEMHFVLKIWLGEVSGYMISFSQLALIYVVILQLSSPITIIAQAANTVKLYHGVVDSFVLLTLFISYMLFAIGADATALYWTMIVILFLAHFIRLYILNKIIHYSLRDYFIKVIFPFIVMFLVTLIAIRVEHKFICEGFARFFVSLVVSGLLNITLFFIVCVDKAERNLIKVVIINRFKN